MPRSIPSTPPLDAAASPAGAGTPGADALPGTVAEPHHAGRAKRVATGLARAAISLGLVALLVWKVGAQNTLERLSMLDPYALVGAAILVVVTYLLHAARWGFVLRSLGNDWSFATTLRETWVGYFFNQLLPSSVGGDGMRALRLYRGGVPAGTALRSVLAERVYGLVACVLMSCCAVPLMLLRAPGSPAALIVELVTAAGLVGILVLLRPQMLRFRPVPVRISTELGHLSEILLDRRHRLQAIAMSIAMQVTVAGAVALLCVGLAVPVNPLFVVMLFQPVTLITLLPISFAGWGLREGGLVAVLGALGVARVDALSLSLAIGAVMLVTSLPGWLFFGTAAPRQPA